MRPEAKSSVGGEVACSRTRGLARESPRRIARCADIRLALHPPAAQADAAARQARIAHLASATPHRAGTRVRRAGDPFNVKVGAGGIRDIEFRPRDAQGLWEKEKVLLADDMLEMLTAGIGPLEAVPDPDPRAPALEYRFLDGVGKIGFIASVSRPFCLNCNRIRLTSDGQLRYCLFAVEETDVKGLMRSGGGDDAIRQAIRATIQKKWLGHEINTKQFIAPPRPMYAIGG